MKRVLTAAVLMPLVTWVILGSPPYVFLAVVTLVAVLCYFEFAGIADAHGYEANSPLAYAAGFVFLVAPKMDIAILVLVAMAAMVMAMRHGSMMVALPQASSVVFGVVYIFGAWRTAIGLHQFNPHWLLYALALNWVGDVAAFYVGSNFGRNKLAPGISPGKTWEGSIASVVFSAILGVLYLRQFIPATGVLEALLVSVAANAAGQFGDLAESSIKRGAGLKDSGNLLPGHGGWLDRVDSSLFAMPVVYFWLARETITGR